MTAPIPWLEYVQRNVLEIKTFGDAHPEAEEPRRYASRLLALVAIARATYEANTSPSLLAALRVKDALEAAERVP
jgi:hypothetical protein